MKKYNHIFYDSLRRQDEHNLVENGSIGALPKYVKYTFL